MRCDSLRCGRSIMALLCSDVFFRVAVGKDGDAELQTWTVWAQPGVTVWSIDISLPRADALPDLYCLSCAALFRGTLLDGRRSLQLEHVLGRMRNIDCTFVTLMNIFRDSQAILSDASLPGVRFDVGFLLSVHGIHQCLMFSPHLQIFGLPSLHPYGSTERGYVDPNRHLIVVDFGECACTDSRSSEKH